MQIVLFVYYPGVKIESSNLLVDMMQSIVEFKMKVLEVLECNLTVASLNSKNYTFDLFQKGHSFVCIGRTVK